MEQKGYLKNITGTMCAVDITLTVMSFNDTPIVPDVTPQYLHNYNLHTDYTYSCTSVANNVVDNETIVSEKKMDLISEAELLFGKMRAANDDERARVENYVESISTDLGVNFLIYVSRIH